MDDPKLISNPPAEPAPGVSWDEVTRPPTWARALPRGTLLGGRYTLAGPLGAGGMGVVYRGRDEKLERAVAIKMLAPGMLSGDEARRHFRREALALARLNHPSIAAIYDVGEQPGPDPAHPDSGALDYIVMELVPGESLATKLQAGPMALRDATAITLEIAKALEEAHEQGVVHRDLKPANVIITPKGHAKVLDFGLARLLATDVTQTLPATGALAGTPLYMSPEQALGKPVDARTDLWSLGALYYECLAGRGPFEAPNALTLLRAITEQPLTPLRQLRPDAPPEAEQITTRALQKDPTRRYQTAAALAQDASALLLRLSGADALAEAQPPKRNPRWVMPAAAAVLIAAAALGGWLYHRAGQRRWARDQAIPQAQALLDQNKSLAAFALIHQAETYLPADPTLTAFEHENSRLISIESDPVGATVEIRDYVTPGAAPLTLGVTPLKAVRVPKGYFRWKVSKQGAATVECAAQADSVMSFSLTQAANAPAGMVFDPGGDWGTYEAFIGWIGPYKLPPFYVDRYEITNRDYQKFVDSGGYSNRAFWPATFLQSGHSIPWADAMTQFRDATGRPGPSTWSAGHYADGQADFPVSGVSWFEASAYAAYAGKSLPVLAQRYQVAPPDVDEYAVPLSNITSSALAPVGKYQGLGPFGTYDTAGNVREWTANIVDNDLRFILGGSWKSPAYLYSSPEALTPWDRADGNGFRCVNNLGPLPAKAAQPFHSVARDFSKYKPVSDDVFRAYSLLYAYPKTPLNAKVEGIVKETDDWREEKVTFDAAYNGERMAAYLFLPRRVKPPYQTVLFFPSARVMFLPPDSSNVGDINFFDYVVQSGRAVLYPVYDDTYERRLKYTLPSGGEVGSIVPNWYKDAARSLDYLATRPDIDSSRLAYLGVSMGSADGVIVATLLQDRLKTVIFLDGGYFLQTSAPGLDQADFAPRLKKPVLMVNGRYDYTFPVDTAQNPMFQMLGTPAEDKSHVILDTPHDVTEKKPQLVKAVLDWLDKYLGRVGS
jgi:hypothetical protein